MGQKVNPIGMRLQVNRTWDSRWYADTKDYGDLLMEDLHMREFIKKDCAQAGVSKVIIERPHKKCRVTIHTARPGVIIGKKGADIETLRKKLANMTESELHLNIIEVRKPELDAQLVGESIAQQLERRVSFRRAMKRAVQNAMRMGALGIRVNVAGRLGGAEIARTEWYREGRVPLHTLRADIDYSNVEMILEQVEKGTSVIKVACSVITKAEVDALNNGGFISTLEPTIYKTGEITLQWSDDSFV